MVGGIGRNQKPGPLVIFLNPRLDPIIELLTIHTFGGRGSPTA
jgi:hypothetical protein